MSLASVIAWIGGKRAGGFKEGTGDSCRPENDREMGIVHVIPYSAKR
jgi:hypothetical protein